MFDYLGNLRIDRLQAQIGGNDFNLHFINASFVTAPLERGAQEGVHNARDVAVALAAFGLLQWWKVSPWLVVLLSAAAGEWVRG